MPDNLKSGVSDPWRYEPGVNRSYQELAQHYGVAILPARPNKPRDKAKVEKAVQEVERQVLAPLRHEQFTSFATLNAAIAQGMERLNGRVMHGYGLSRQAKFYASRPTRAQSITNPAFCLWLLETSQGEPRLSH